MLFLVGWAFSHPTWLTYFELLVPGLSSFPFHNLAFISTLLFHFTLSN